MLFGSRFGFGSGFGSVLVRSALPEARGSSVMAEDGCREAGSVLVRVWLRKEL